MIELYPSKSETDYCDDNGRLRGCFRNREIWYDENPCYFPVFFRDKG